MTGLMIKALLAVSLTAATTAIMTTTASAADFLSVCERSAPVQTALTALVNKPCAAITSADLAAITRVALINKQIATLDPLDFANLDNLQTLNLNRNTFTSLPPHAFALLPNLQTLVIIRSQLTTVPEDLAQDNPKLVNLVMWGNKYTSLPNELLDRLEADQTLRVLQVDTVLDQAQKDELTSKFPAGGQVELSFE